MEKGASVSTCFVQWASFVSQIVMYLALRADVQAELKDRISNADFSP